MEGLPANSSNLRPVICSSAAMVPPASGNEPLGMGIEIKDKPINWTHVLISFPMFWVLPNPQEVG